MKALALDISTSAGWALMEAGTLVKFGGIELEKTVKEYGEYPWSYLFATWEMANRLSSLVHELRPDVVVVEETNLGRNRYSQKTLEFIHCNMLRNLREWLPEETPPNVIYISSSSWRKCIGMEMSKEDKKNNSTLSRAKSRAKSKGEKLDKSALGLKGRVTKKHLAVRFANATYGLQLKMKDNDQADAICLGTAFFRGAVPADGVMG